MFIDYPNLPSGKVKCVIVDRNAPKELFYWLSNNGINYILSFYQQNIIKSVSTHPDMQICHIGGADFVCSPDTYRYYKKELELYDVNITCGNTAVKCNYPYDIAYNVVITGDFLLHNTKYTDKLILEYAKSRGACIFSVKQGYTKCATCIIDNNAIITADKGIKKVSDKNGIDCLLIEDDSISLSKECNGFFGGCCGFIDKKTLLFCGDIKRHKSYNAIYDFCCKYGVNMISSYDGMLNDIGSIIPVIQE